MKNKKLFFVATVESSVNAFLLNHIRILSNYFEITVIVNTSDLSFLKKQGLNVKVISLNINRNVRIFSDFFCLFKLIIIFLKNKPIVVHSITPKAGLLAMLASFITLTPFRIHTFTGQVWVTKFGLRRYALKYFDHLIALLCTFCIVDSISQQKFLIKHNVVSKKKSFVFGSGSVSGVNLKRFKANKDVLVEIRKKLLIPKNVLIFIYLGRLNKDKGILDLAKAFSLIKSKNAFLLFVGPDEGDFVEKIKKLNSHKLDRLRFVNYTTVPEQYLAASNVLCLPSHREGFGSVIIEAAATNLPAIGSKIYGISDAILDKKTGLIHPPANDQAILKCIEFFIKNPSKIRIFGKAAKIRAKKEFDSNQMSNYWLNFYKYNVINTRSFKQSHPIEPCND
jgi:glycosyltransferase involved in cell wall biosynthesis